MEDLVNMDVNEGSLNEFEAVEEKLATQAPEEALPDKYRGKSVADIVKMHQEAEKLIGRQANEVAEVRSLADQLIKRQIQPTVAPQETNTSVDDIDFFADPVSTVNKVIANHPSIRMAQEKSAELDRMTSKQKLVSKHPDYTDILADSEFAQFVTASPIRQQLFQAADKQYDFLAADELLTTYKELKAAKQKIVSDGANQLKEESKRQLNAASVDAGGSGEVGRKVYRRADLIRLQIQNPDRYKELSEDIYVAYQEGRVR